MKHFVRATFVAGALVTSAACGGSGGTSNEPSLRADSLAPAAEAEPAESSSTIATPVDLGNGGSLDLNAPHDDVALCAAIDSGSFAAAVGGVQVFSIPGPDAEELATIRPGSGAFPLLGQCRVTIDDATYVSLQVVDMVTLEEAADDYLARLDILEDSSLEGREVEIEPGSYVLTEGSVFGHTGRFNVACNVTFDDGLQFSPGDFTPAIEAACLKALAELAPSLA